MTFFDGTQIETDGYSLQKVDNLMSLRGAENNIFPPTCRFASLIVIRTTEIKTHVVKYFLTDCVNVEKGYGKHYYQFLLKLAKTHDR